MRRLLTVALTFLGGLFFVLEFVLPERLPEWLGGAANPLTPYLGMATDLVIILGTMAFLLGPINLVRGHLAGLLRGGGDRLSSLVFLVFLAGSVVVAAAVDLVPHPVWTAAYNALFYGVIFGFGTSSFAILAFYLVSAAYRSFRLNSLDAAVMMFAAAVVLLGSSPIGEWMTRSLPEMLRLPVLESWLMSTPNSAVQRAVAIGTFAGAFAAALRYWLSLGTRSQ